MDYQLSSNSLFTKILTSISSEMYYFYSVGTNHDTNT